MQDQKKLKVVVLTGIDSAPAVSTFLMLARLPEVQVLAILSDLERPSFKKRLSNLRRNVRREGLGYIFSRLGDAAVVLLDNLAARVISRQEVSELLRRSFPDRISSLADLGRRSHIPVHCVGNLNSPAAAETLRLADADLGIVFGTRILKRSTFAIPRLGCINVHKGKVPEYRGMPPGFWELWEGQKSAGVTIHVVDDGLDTGAIVGEDTVSIHAQDSVETLQRKLDGLAAELLARCVVDYAKGRVSQRPQPPTKQRPRTSPTRAQRRELEKRIGLSVEKQRRTSYILKSLIYLTAYYSGLFHLVRAIRGLRGVDRACVLLYHRVNDLTDDALTTSIERFAAHMVAIRTYYSGVPTSRLVRAIQSDKKLPRHSVAIHFDDCYRDVFTNASSLMAQAGLPGTAFVSSGFVGTGRGFAHDAGCPVTQENLAAEQVRALLGRGFDIGSHTVNHVDLGQCSDETALNEVFQSKKDLEALAGKPVRWISYPFGRVENIRAGVVDLVREAGYEAMFAAYGGTVTGSDDCFHLQRLGISGQYRALDLLMEIEGMSVATLHHCWEAGRRGFLRRLLASFGQRSRTAAVSELQRPPNAVKPLTAVRPANAPAAD